MKLLVTGATGFIGRHVVECLVNGGHEVTAIARNPEKAQGFPWWGKVKFIAHDLHAKPPDPSWSAHDAAMHLAWPGLPNYGRPFHFESTLPADYAFLKGLVSNGLRRLLVTGTCLEYGVRNGCLRESDVTDPAISYALAKDTLHKFLVALQAERRFVLQWARVFYVHGPGQNPDSLLSRLDRAVDARRTSFDMSPGDQLRDYLTVQQVARRLVALAEHPELEGTTNVCSGKPISVRSLAEQHLQRRAAHLALNFGALPYAPHEAMAFWGDASRLAAIRGVDDKP